MLWEVLVLFLSDGKSHSGISDHFLHGAETQPITYMNIISKGSSLVFTCLFRVTKILSTLALLVWCDEVQLGPVVLVMWKYFSQMERLCNASQSQPDLGSIQYLSWQVVFPPLHFWICFIPEDWDYSWYWAKCILKCSCFEDSNAFHTKKEVGWEQGEELEHRANTTVLTGLKGWRRMQQILCRAKLCVIVSFFFRYCELPSSTPGLTNAWISAAQILF